MLPGDRLLKVNGDSTELMSLEAAWSSVARATRPVMLHFLAPVSITDPTAHSTAAAAADNGSEHGGTERGNMAPSVRAY